MNTKSNSQEPQKPDEPSPEHLQWLRQSPTQEFINKLTETYEFKINQALGKSRVPETTDLELRLHLNEAWVYKNILRVIKEGK